MADLKFLNLGRYTGKLEGDPITEDTWNGVFLNIEDAVNNLYENGTNNPDTGGGSVEDGTHVSFDSTGKHNLNIVTTASDQYTKNGELKGGKINIEPVSDLQIKPGDDITLYSHHRKAENQKEVIIKVMNGANDTVNESELPDYPVDLQLNVSNINLTTKDKATYISEVNRERQAAGKGNTSDASNVLNIEVNSNKGDRGYLKVRALAIDLRCEEHGGIALLPKGEDGSHHMNKIKFEHGGGDGLEFGTFNAEKTSIYTPEYRFKKDGVIKLATRTLLDNTPGKGGNNKYTGNNQDPTTHYSYQKNAEDDFYDNIDANDPTCTWEDIVKTVTAFSGSSEITLNPNLNLDLDPRVEILSKLVSELNTIPALDSLIDLESHVIKSIVNLDNIVVGKIYSLREIESILPFTANKIIYMNRGNSLIRVELEYSGEDEFDVLNDYCYIGLRVLPSLDIKFNSLLKRLSNIRFSTLALFIKSGNLGVFNRATTNFTYGDTLEINVYDPNQDLLTQFTLIDSDTLKATFKDAGEYPYELFMSNFDLLIFVKESWDNPDIYISLVPKVEIKSGVELDISNYNYDYQLMEVERDNFELYLVNANDSNRKIFKYNGTVTNDDNITTIVFDQVYNNNSNPIAPNSTNYFDVTNVDKFDFGSVV